jgi:hypothetical protein
MTIGYIIVGMAFIIAGLCCVTVFIKGDNNNVNTDTDNNIE